MTTADGDASPTGAEGGDASNEAGDDAGEITPPPPYDFAVKCAADPCATQVAARGGGHACAILVDGSVRCWGSNDSGQLGTGRTDAGGMPPYEGTPRQVAGISNAIGVTTTGSGVAGSTCIVSAGGEVACFGSDASGQLGRGGAPSNSAHPDVAVIEGLQAKSVTLASTFALALGTDNRLWSWGSNDALQLARAPSDPDAGPIVPVSSPARADRVSSTVRSLAGTTTNGFAVTESGELLSWGGATSEQLGRASSLQINPMPAAVDLEDVASVATGPSHACALRRGRVFCWGDNAHGQLGAANKANVSFPWRVALPKDLYAVAVAAGGDNACAISSEGEVYCWGANGSGQVTRDVGRDQPSPVRIVGLGEQVVSVAVMDASICALLRGGSITCWGDNLFGQLGRGTRDVDIHVDAAPVVFK